MKHAVRLVTTAHGFTATYLVTALQILPVVSITELCFIIHYAIIQYRVSISFAISDSDDHQVSVVYCNIRKFHDLTLIEFLVTA